MGAVAPIPWRVPAAERVLVGKTITEAVAAEAADGRGGGRQSAQWQRVQDSDREDGRQARDHEGRGAVRWCEDRWHEWNHPKPSSPLVTEHHCGESAAQGHVRDGGCRIRTSSRSTIHSKRRPIGARARNQAWVRIARP